MLLVFLQLSYLFGVDVSSDIFSARINETLAKTASIFGDKAWDCKVFSLLTKTVDEHIIDVCRSEVNWGSIEAFVKVLY